MFGINTYTYHCNIFIISIKSFPKNKKRAITDHYILHVERNLPHKFVRILCRALWPNVLVKQTKVGCIVTHVRVDT